MASEAPDEAKSMLRLASEIVAAYVSNNPVPAGELPDLIRRVHSALETIGTEPLPVTTARPAVAVERSITPDYLVCLEDGKKLKMLKRYLRSRYKLTPEEYRAKWGLGPDYPMVAPNYAARRSAYAKEIGLGRTATSGSRRRPA